MWSKNSPFNGLGETVHSPMLHLNSGTIFLFKYANKIPCQRSNLHLKLIFFAIVFLFKCIIVKCATSINAWRIPVLDKCSKGLLLLFYWLLFLSSLYNLLFTFVHTSKLFFHRLFCMLQYGNKCEVDWLISYFWKELVVTTRRFDQYALMIFRRILFLPRNKITELLSES